MPKHNEVAGPVTGTVVQAGTITGGVTVHQSQQALPIPRQLPSAPRLFVNRTGELARLTSAVSDRDEDTAAAVSVICGTGGVGKTSLALHWSHRFVQRFPDGQLYVDLRGFDPGGTPTPAASAVHGFLSALGVSPAAIPADTDSRTALYRSAVDGKRMLILLDNARDSAQVRPLLPGSASCAVVVTSRHHLAGLALHGADMIDLDTLPDREARRLLADHLGEERLSAEPDAVADILECCAGLPLALGIVAARAAALPRFPLAALAEELHDASARLDALEVDDLGVNLRAVFSWSLQSLRRQQADLFLLLGSAPGPDISLAAAAALAASPVPRVRALLRDLEAAHLVQQHAPGRYRMHDLVRLYAAERCRLEHPEPARDAALHRLVDFYLRTAHSGDRLIDSFRQPIGLEPAAPVPVDFAGDRDAALAWFDKEDLCVLAAQRTALDRSWDLSVLDIAWSMQSFYRLRGHRDSSLVLWRTALEAALRLGAPAHEASARLRLGRAHLWLGDTDSALGQLERALSLTWKTGDTRYQAHVRFALAETWETRGDIRAALEHSRECVRLYRAAAEEAWEGGALTLLGRHQIGLGRFDEAAESCERALRISREHGYPIAEAQALRNLGSIARHRGRLDEAVARHCGSIALFRSLGYLHEEAPALVRLGEAHQALGQEAEARLVWGQALELYREQRHEEEADRVRRLLAALPPEPDAAA